MSLRYILGSQETSHQRTNGFASDSLPLELIIVNLMKTLLKTILFIAVIIIVNQRCSTAEDQVVIQILHSKNPILMMSNFKLIKKDENTNFIKFSYSRNEKGGKASLIAYVVKPFDYKLSDSSKVFFYRYNFSRKEDSVIRSSDIINIEGLNKILKENDIELFNKIEKKYPKMDLTSYELNQVDEDERFTTYEFVLDITKYRKEITLFVKQPYDIFFSDFDNIFLSNILCKIKESDSVYNVVGLSCDYDTLFSYTKSNDNYDFNKGKYYYYYNHRSFLLDSNQKEFYETHKDSIIENCINEIPSFD